MAEEHLKIRVLGYPEITLDNTSADNFISNKALMLFCYLIMNNRTHPRESLATLFWGEMSEDRAKANLRQALHNIQKLFPDYFEVTRQTVMLLPERVFWLDAEQLEQAENLSLEKIQSLYRGAFMEGLYVDDSPEIDEWLRSQRERYRLAYMALLDQIVTTYTDNGDWPQAEQACRLLIEIEPWRETSHRYLMLCLAHQGKYDAALAQYDTCRQILEEELAVKLSAETEKLYNRIRQARQAPRHNLLPWPTEFIEREEERQLIQQWLGKPLPRLITIVGPGGIGKSRLAWQIAHEKQNDFMNGVAFVPLAGSENLVITLLENLIQSDFIPPLAQNVRPADHLKTQLQDKEMLLVLDNLEHLLEEIEFLSSLIETCPDMKFIVTSREQINIRWEQIMDIDGLLYPDTAKIESPEKYGAIELFKQSAQRISHKFNLDETNLESVVRISQLVEGMPLALEMAATWVRSESCEAIAGAIQHNLNVLSTELRDVPLRQLSMHATFDYSWQMLGEEERVILPRLSVFHAGFTPEAALEVAQADVQILQTLAEKSLLRFTETHCSIHELLRQYASEHLTDAQYDEMQQQHSQYYMGLIATRYEALFSAENNDAMQEILTDIENVRAAWQFAIHNREATEEFERSIMAMQKVYDLNAWAEPAIDLFMVSADILAERGEQRLSVTCRGYVPYFLLRAGRHDESIEVAEALLVECQEINDQRLQALLLNLLNNLYFDRTDYKKAREYAQQAFELAQELGNVPMQASFLNSLGMIADALGEPERAVQLLSEGLEIARGTNIQPLIGMTVGNLGMLIAYSDPAEANKYFLEAMQIAETIGDHYKVIKSHYNLTISAWLLRDFAEHTKQIETASRLAEEAGDRRTLALVTYNRAEMAYLNGDYAIATQLFQEGLEFFQSIQAEREMALGLARLGDLARLAENIREVQKCFQQAAPLALKLDLIEVQLIILLGLADTHPEKSTGTKWINAVRHYPRTVRHDLRPLLEMLHRSYPDREPEQELDIGKIIKSELDI